MGASEEGDPDPEAEEELLNPDAERATSEAEEESGPEAEGERGSDDDAGPNPEAEEGGLGVQQYELHFDDSGVVFEAVRFEPVNILY